MSQRHHETLSLPWYHELHKLLPQRLGPSEGHRPPERRSCGNLYRRLEGHDVGADHQEQGPGIRHDVHVRGGRQDKACGAVPTLFPGRGKHLFYDDAYLHRVAGSRLVLCEWSCWRVSRFGFASCVRSRCRGNNRTRYSTFQFSGDAHRLPLSSSDRTNGRGHSVCVCLSHLVAC